jgi:hypothetical protein
MRRPAIVTIAAVLQLLLAATFAISVATALLYGPAAQRAAERDLERQGIPPETLTGENLRFDEGLVGTVPAIVIVAILVTLAVLNLNGRRLGQRATWVFQPLLAVAGAILVSGQVFLVQGLERALTQNGITGVDVKALVAAAGSAFPSWYPIESWAKLILVTAGSVATIVLLALPQARAFFRAQRKALGQPVDAGAQAG